MPLCTEQMPRLGGRTWYLTLLPMSAEPQRVFSGAKITLSDRRCRVGDDAVEAVECLKSWQRDGLIAAAGDYIRAVEEMLNALCEEDVVKLARCMVSFEKNSNLYTPCRL